MQKFHKGDLVHVTKDMPPWKKYFPSDFDAVVIGSHADQFGSNSTATYTLFRKEGGEISWYEEDQLTLIEKDRNDLLEQWKKEQEEECALKSDLDWIFKNGPEVAENAHTACVTTLGKCFGIENMWGSRGEGIVFVTRMISVMAAASPFLMSHDKEGWLKFCDDHKKKSMRKKESENENRS